MGKYDHFTREALLDRLEELERALEKERQGAPRPERFETEHKQHRINFLSILMNTILSNISVVIVVKDIFDGFKYIYFNKAAEDFMGAKVGDILNQTDFELFPDPRRAHEIRTEDYHTIKTGRMEKEMAEYERPNGEMRVVNIIRLLITNPDPGASPLLLVMLWDITEQRQNQLDLIKAREADEMKNAFIANMSHEIRTPLNAIVGFSRLITETDNASEQQEFLNIINNNSDLLLQLINDILDFSKLESGTLSYNKIGVDLRNLCHEVHITKCLKMTSDVALLYNLDEMPPVVVWTDPQRVEQVLLNLLSNAIKFTTKGFISLSYEVEGEFVRISVMDTGTGIPDNQQSSIFERFVKLDDFRQGTGLGLAICKMIVERLGGEIGVKSKVGRGSTFWFTLPIGKPLEVQKPFPDEEALSIVEPALPGQYTLLVAEDVYENYMLLQAVLKKEYRLIYASNGVDAVNLYHRHQPDLILMDLKMPEMDGFEATLKIREYSVSIPILALTAFAFDSDKEKARACSFTDYLVKPVDILLLKYKIRYYLNKLEK